MASAPLTSGLDLDHSPGKPPILRPIAVGHAAHWAARHRNALRAAVTQHGALIVRGLGLQSAGETEAVFRQLGQLMIEREAVAPRRRYAFSAGLYSASKWPPETPMRMHHELSYA